MSTREHPLSASVGCGRRYRHKYRCFNDDIQGTLKPVPYPEYPTQSTHTVLRVPDPGYPTPSTHPGLPPECTVPPCGRSRVEQRNARAIRINIVQQSKGLYVYVYVYVNKRMDMQQRMRMEQCRMYAQCGAVRCDGHARAWLCASVRR